MAYTPSNPIVAAGQRSPHPQGDRYRAGVRALHGHAGPVASYDIAFQRSDGLIRSQRLSAPASPVFLSAFSAFARGTLITTTRGPVAVEDLTPGMKLITNERGPSPLLWIGSMTLTPDSPQFDRTAPALTRVTAESLGMGRPLMDFVAGPSARILQRSPGAQNQTLMPVHKMVDGMSVIAMTPPAPVQLFHLLLYRHATITAAGLSVETYHPGPGFEASLSHEDRIAFLALFPHVLKPSDFGSLAHPRQPLRHVPDGPALV